jgi:hypothetical protein
MYRVTDTTNLKAVMGYMTADEVATGKFRQKLVEFATKSKTIVRCSTSPLTYTMDDDGVITVAVHFSKDGTKTNVLTFIVEPCTPDLRIENLVLPTDDVVRYNLSPEIKSKVFFATPEYKSKAAKKAEKVEPEPVLTKREAWEKHRNERKQNAMAEFSAKYSYTEVSTKLREVLRHAEYDYALRFSRSSSSIYVIAQKKGKVVNIRVSDHGNSKKNMHYSDMFFDPKQIVNGEFETAIKSLSN